MSADGKEKETKVSIGKVKLGGSPQKKEQAQGLSPRKESADSTIAQLRKFRSGRSVGRPGRK